MGFTKAQSQTGVVTLIQRFGGSNNLNVHFHTLYFDKIYELSTDKRPILFCPCVEPTLVELKTVFDKIIKKSISLLERRGFLVKDNEDPLCLSIDTEDTFSQVQTSSAIYRFATGPNKGRKALVLKTISNRDSTSGTGLVATHSSFSLHAGVAVGGGERKKIERLDRYIARPPIAQDRLRINDLG